MRIKTLGALLSTLLPGAALAIPAAPFPVDVQQPDGRTVSIGTFGDEWFHWQEDGKGFTVVEREGVFEYAALDASDHLVSTGLVVGRDDPRSRGLVPHVLPPLPVRTARRDAALRSLSPDGRPTTAIAPIGVVRNLVVLCRFSNHAIPANGHPQLDYDTLMNSSVADPQLCPTGSVQTCYIENSYGQITLTSVVSPWVALPNTEAYYAHADSGLGGAYPASSAGMVEAALARVDSLVNFADYDQNLDGYIDAIDIIHSGYGAEAGGAGVANRIWSHKGTLASIPGGQWTSADTNSNGVPVKVYDYHTEPALWGNSGAGITRIGVIAHETGHFFGLPDLYDTDNSSFGIGSWCMMSNSWGFAGDQLRPPHFSAWCKDFLNWVNPGIVVSGATVTLREAETFPEAVYIVHGFPNNEYLLVENRQPQGFDSGVPQGGLLVWHIDETKSGNTMEGFPGQPGWPGNGAHYKVALLQADGAYDLERKVNQGDAGDPYRSGGVVDLSHSTTPNTNSYIGTVFPTGISISEVSAAGTTMTFRVAPGTWVDFAYVGFENGAFATPFNTLVEGVNDAPPGYNVIMKGGVTSEHPVITKQVQLKSYQSTATIGQ